MIVDNGTRLPLVIRGIFDGDCGVSRGVVSFRPTAGVVPKASHGALLDGEPVLLTDIASDGDGLSFTARWRTLS